MKRTPAHPLYSAGIAVLIFSLAIPPAGANFSPTDPVDRPRGGSVADVESGRGRLDAGVDLQSQIESHRDEVAADDAPDAPEMGTRQIIAADDFLADTTVSPFNKDVLNQASESGHLEGDTDIVVTRNAEGTVTGIEIPGAGTGGPIISMKFEGDNYKLTYHGAGDGGTAREFVVWNQSGKGPEAAKTRRNYTTMTVAEGKTIEFSGTRARVANGGAGFNMKTDRATARVNINSYAALDQGNGGQAKARVEGMLADSTVTHIVSHVTGATANDNKANLARLTGTVLAPSGVTGGFDNIISVRAVRENQPAGVAGGAPPAVNGPANPDATANVASSPTEPTLVAQPKNAFVKIERKDAVAPNPAVPAPGGRPAKAAPVNAPAPPGAGPWATMRRAPPERSLPVRLMRSPETLPAPVQDRAAQAFGGARTSHFVVPGTNLFVVKATGGESESFTGGQAIVVDDQGAVKATSINGRLWEYNGGAEPRNGFDIQAFLPDAQVF